MVVVLGFRGEETHGFYVLSILGAASLVCAFHCSHVIAKWSLVILHFTENGENGASAIPRKLRFSYSVRSVGTFLFLEWVQTAHLSHVSDTDTDHTPGDQQPLFNVA